MMQAIAGILGDNVSMINDKKYEVTVTNHNRGTETVHSYKTAKEAQEFALSIDRCMAGASAKVERVSK